MRVALLICDLRAKFVNTRTNDVNGNNLVAEAREGAGFTGYIRALYSCPVVQFEVFSDAVSLGLRSTNPPKFGLVFSAPAMGWFVNYVRSMDLRREAHEIGREDLDNKMCW